MALVTAGATAQKAIISNLGTAPQPDAVAIRIQAGTGKVYVEYNSTAAAATSFYITGTEVYSRNLKLGDYISVCTDSTDIPIVVDADPQDTFGS